MAHRLILLAASLYAPAIAQEPSQASWRLMRGGHDDAITQIAYSNDGAILAAGSQDGTVKLWDAKSGHLLRVFGEPDLGRFPSQPYAGDPLVWSVAISPDNELLAVANDAQEIRIWALASGDLVRVLDVTIVKVGSSALKKAQSELEAPGAVVLSEFAHKFDVARMVAFGPGGRTLAAACSTRWQTSQEPIVWPRRTIKIWGAGSGKLLRCVPGHREGPSRRIKSWGAGSEELLRCMAGYLEGPRCLAFSPDGKWLATAGGDKIVNIWNADSGALARALAGHSDTVTVVAFSGDSKRLASAGHDRFVRLWDVESGRTLNSIRVESGPVDAMAFRPDGGMVATVARASNTIEVFDTGTGERLRTLDQHRSGVSWVAFSPDGKQLASAGGRRSLGSEYGGDFWVNLWNPADGTLIQSLGPPTGIVECMAFDITGKLLITGHGRDPDGDDEKVDHRIALWDVDNARFLRTLSGHTGAVTAIAVDPRGDRVLSGSTDGTVKMWDIATGKMTRALSDHTGMVLGVSFMDGGNRLATCTGTWTRRDERADNELKLRDPIDGAVKHSFLLPKPQARAVRWSRDKAVKAEMRGAYIAVTEARTNRRLLRMATERTDSPFALSPDGRSIVYFRGNEWGKGALTLVATYDTKTLRVFEGPRQFAKAVGTSCEGESVMGERMLGFSDDGSLLAAKFGRVISVWKVDSGDLVGELQVHERMAWRPFVAAYNHARRLTAHTVGWSNDIIEVLDAEGNQVVGLLAPEWYSWTTELAFSRDGRVLASSDGDLNILLWSITP